MERERLKIAYGEEFYPPVPTKATKFWRKNWIYQFFKFIRLNYKIMKMVVSGHS